MNGTHRAFYAYMYREISPRSRGAYIYICLGELYALVPNVKFRNIYTLAGVCVCINIGLINGAVVKF